MLERIVFMQIEDDMVTFERENGNSIIYPRALVSEPYQEGDIIKAIVHSEELIELLEIDVEEMERRSARIKDRKSRIRERAIRSTNEA